MSELDDIKARLDRLEHDVITLREDSATTRVMAAMADRDSAAVAGVLRGHTAVLNALRETQVEQGQVLAQHGAVLEEHSAVLEEHGRMLREHGQTLAEQGQILTVLVAGQERHEAMLGEILRRLPDPSQ